MKNAKKFFRELVKTEEAKAIFATMEKPESEEETIAAYIEVAAKLGVALTAAEVKEYLATVGDVAHGEIDDEELSQLVGGRHCADCHISYKQKQNCWILDACDSFFIDYDGYLCYDKNAAPIPEDNLLDKFDSRIDPDVINTGNSKRYG